MVRLYTIGHSTRPIEELVSLLAGHGVRRLVDVRRFPGSRRHPQFAREALAASLVEAGVEYVHEPGLGGRRAALPDSPNIAWRSESFRGYADHMRTPEFQQALDRLVARAGEAPTTVLCAEAVPWRCHRQLIADAVVAAGHEVLHILGPGRADRHELNPHARLLPGGGLVYDQEEGGQMGLFKS